MSCANSSVGTLATFLGLAQGRVASAAQLRLDAHPMNDLSSLFYHPEQGRFCGRPTLL